VSVPLRVLVIDDEAPARRKLLRYLEKHDDVVCVGEAASAQEAIVAVGSERPEVLFLDVQMPGGDGFDVARAVVDAQDAPRIVFVTAHDAFAVRAFEAEAFDYLLKPVDEDRLAAVLARIRRDRDRGGAHLARLLASLRPPEPYPERLFVQTGERAYFVPVADIGRIEADRNYVHVHARGSVHHVRTTLDALERRLDPAKFVRINRSEVVRIDAIRELEPWFHGEYKVFMHDGTVTTWSRRYVARRPDLQSNALPGS
jgi:two-component system LytT family response regulator